MCTSRPVVHQNESWSAIIRCVALLTLWLVACTALKAEGRDSTKNSLASLPASSSDSQIIALTLVAHGLIDRNSDSAFLLARRALDFSSGRGFQSGVAHACNTIGWAFLSKGRYDSSVFYLLKARQIFASLGSPRDMARVSINLSEAYTRQSHFATAIEHLLEAESAATKAKDERILTDVKRQLGIIYRETGEKQKSISYLKEALAGFEKQKDLRRYINAAVSLCIVYNEVNLLDSALVILRSCLNKSVLIPRNEYQQGMIYEHLGNTWKRKKEYGQALNNYLLAYRNFRKIGNTADIAYEAINIGRAYVALKLFDEAETFFTESLHLADSLELTNYRQEIAQYMSEMYVAKGDWKRAFEYLQKSVEISDSLAAAASLAQTRELTERYEAQKKEQEIVMLKKNNQVNLLTMQKQRAWQLGAGIVVLLLVLMGALAVNRYRLMQRSQRIIEIEKMRNDIASDLHDDIGSTLTSLNIQRATLSRQFEDNPAVTASLKKMAEHTTEMMESISDIVWAINPKQDTMESVIFRMKEFTAEVLEPQNIQYRFDTRGNLSGQLNPRQRKNLYLIFKEIINNAVKYSKGNNVQIEVVSENDWITIDVKDDGIGFDEATVRRGNGLRNIRQRVTELKGFVQLESTLGKGTFVSLQLPYHDLGMKTSDIKSMLPSNKSLRES